jgi:hypothetical protein
MALKAGGLTLDTGALLGAERGSRKLFALVKRAADVGAEVTVPVGVLAQAWRSHNVQVARLLKGCVVEALDEAGAKRVGLLLGQRGCSDVVDASVVAGALARGDTVVTSDRGDMSRLGIPDHAILDV